MTAAVPAPDRAAPNVVHALRASLEAQYERALARPILAWVSRQEDASADPTPPTSSFLSLLDDVPGLVQSQEPASSAFRALSGDGGFLVTVDIDYDDVWRDQERDVLQEVSGTVEGHVLLLTRADAELLQRAPAECLAQHPGPQRVELLDFDTERYGERTRITSLTVAEEPETGTSGAIVAVAVLPNLIPIERQLEALKIIEKASATGPLAPLRCLLGLPGQLADGGDLPDVHARPGEQLDAYQRQCIASLLGTPHFASIIGPPGSGKTTVIVAALRRLLEQGLRVLVVSPTHSAIDNVVEKLLEDPPDDRLRLLDLAVRYAARPAKVSESAARLWVGAKRERRAGTLAKRVEQVLRSRVHGAADLFDRVDDTERDTAPLTRELCAETPLLFGTPIGVLSCSQLRDDPRPYDVLIVDEVSKLTLGEFLAVAVKARRWILVGDDAQLPPYCDAVENGLSLGLALPPELELAMTVGSTLDRTRPGARGSRRILAVSQNPERAARVVEAQLRAQDLGGCVGQVCVCGPEDVQGGLDLLRPGRDPRSQGPRITIDLVPELGVEVERPGFASGERILSARNRATSALVDVGFSLLHMRPWSRRSAIRLRAEGMRHALPKTLPTSEAIAALESVPADATAQTRDDFVQTAALHFAVNVLSVFDWVRGLPAVAFHDLPVLRDVTDVVSVAEPLQSVASPYETVLRRQYRMHPSLSQVPRELFYFGDAMQDGRSGRAGRRVRLLQVEADGRSGEANHAEVEVIVNIVAHLQDRGQDLSDIMIITPYRAQERALRAALRERWPHSDHPEVCTLDRCQGREADHVLISLVRSRATAFFDNPKRWNVALTRAKESLVLVGDIDAYRREASQQRNRCGPHRQPRMSLLAHLIEAYDHTGRS